MTSPVRGAPTMNCQRASAGSTNDAVARCSVAISSPTLASSSSEWVASPPSTNSSTSRPWASVPSGRGAPAKPTCCRWARNACTVGVQYPAVRLTVSPTRTTSVRPAPTASPPAPVSSRFTHRHYRPGPSGSQSRFHQTVYAHEPLRRDVGLLLPLMARNEGGRTRGYAQGLFREAGLLSGRDGGRRLPAHVLGPSAERGAERDLLPPSLGGAAPYLGRTDAGRVPLRREDEPADHALRSGRRDRHLLRAGTGAGRPARAGFDPAPAHQAARRRAPAALPRLPRPAAALRLRVPQRELGRSRPRGQRARRLARGRRAVPLPATARAAVRRGCARGLGGSDPAGAGRRYRRVRVLQARGRADGAFVRPSPRRTRDLTAAPPAGMMPRSPTRALCAREVMLMMASTPST